MSKRHEWKPPRKGKKPMLDREEARSERAREERKPAGGGYRVVKKKLAE